MCSSPSKARWTKPGLCCSCVGSSASIGTGSAQGRDYWRWGSYHWWAAVLQWSWKKYTVSVRPTGVHAPQELDQQYSAAFMQYNILSDESDGVFSITNGARIGFSGRQTTLNGWGRGR
ncbi:hypothetical protein ASPWEDRAFT_294241 [Aspergillus wentii DTO 134E9]|uniref:Uncharacterized protein n=1 Tax=Aspergillus wentii DTO 134E9 TaxID=1073089 RepID=A0A1L9R456_ASPWE|nr:uncharacterized protein ASPWEDRAFT_294241 [Aspergillus wentii DTO 134E9]OJJ29663.1 hypothetical protein ASPWEDRAFT_294241 [Aspergillus wentii DTO 134E9]